MEIRAFITHKKAEKDSDCQDCFRINAENKSLAVSDGMSQSIFQKKWAEILVSAYTDGQGWEPSKEPDNATVKNVLSGKWKDYVLKRIEEQRQEGKDRAADRNERSLVEGKSAGATFLGVRFSGNRWEGDVLGDTCLIEIEDGEIIRIETSQNNSSFDNTPDYYDSNNLNSGKGQVKHIKGVLESNKILLLVSDPFSDLFNEHKKTGSVKELVEQLFKLGSHKDFVALVDDWREQLEMHNDDSTLIIITHDDSDAFNVTNDDSCFITSEKQCEEKDVALVKKVRECVSENNTEKECEDAKEFIKDLIECFHVKSCKDKKWNRKHIIGAIRKAIERLLDKYVIKKK